ncbi:MAG: B12-binding domain-containing radical SAM protein, partial [Desulfomonilaceae bacterium]
YHKAYRSVRPHPRAAVEQVIRWAYEPDSQVAELYLMDPSFNLSPHYRDALALMAQLRRCKEIRGHTELRAEFLDDDDPARLSDAGVASVEIGLQSVNPKALRLAGRSSRIDRIARAVERLKKESIEVTTGIILGLPGDAPEDFQNTLQWLKTTEAYTVVHPFLLSVLPGTDFRQRAPELGLAYDPRPPYYVQAAPCFSEDDLRDAMLACETTFDMELDHIDLPSMVDHAPELTVSLDAADYVSKWIVDTAKRTWKPKLSLALKKASDPFIFWFRGADCRSSEDDITRILNAFFDANPHAFVHVVFEYPTPPRPRFLQRLAARVAQPATYVNKSMQSWIKGDGVLSPSFTILVHDPLDQTERNRVLDGYEDLATIVWDIAAPDEEIISQAAAPCLVSAAVKPGSPYGYHLFRMLRQRFGSSPEDVLFRDHVLQEFWLRSTSQWHSHGFPERILMDVD